MIFFFLIQDIIFTLAQSPSVIFMRLLIKFVIVTYPMCFKRIWIVLVWKYGLVIYRRFHSSLLFLMLTLKRDNWALIKKREEKKKKLSVSLGLNLTSMRSKEFKFRPTMYPFGLRVCVLHFGLFFFFLVHEQ